MEPAEKSPDEKKTDDQTTSTLPPINNNWSMTTPASTSKVAVEADFEQVKLTLAHMDEVFSKI